MCNYIMKQKIISIKININDDGQFTYKILILKIIEFIYI